MILREPLHGVTLPSFAKVVVDVQKGILAYGCELHIDCAEELLSDGSESVNLWGANAYPEKQDIQFVSLINIRPTAGNRSMEIESADIRDQVKKIVRALMFS